jgi:prolipoprotein diacylglyceryltransferase
VIALSASVRIFLEAFRGDSLITPGNLRAAQVWGLIVLAICFVMIKAWNQKAAASATALEDVQHP